MLSHGVYLSLPFRSIGSSYWRDGATNYLASKCPGRQSVGWRSCGKEMASKSDHRLDAVNVGVKVQREVLPGLGMKVAPEPGLDQVCLFVVPDPAQPADLPSPADGDLVGAGLVAAGHAQRDRVLVGDRPPQGAEVKGHAVDGDQ